MDMLAYFHLYTILRFLRQIHILTCMYIQCMKTVKTRYTNTGSTAQVKYNW
jgi:hypothetical protein